MRRPESRAKEATRGARPHSANTGAAVISPFYEGNLGQDSG